MTNQSFSSSLYQGAQSVAGTQGFYTGHTVIRTATGTMQKLCNAVTATACGSKNPIAIEAFRSRHAPLTQGTRPCSEPSPLEIQMVKMDAFFENRTVEDARKNYWGLYANNHFGTYTM